MMTELVFETRLAAPLWWLLAPTAFGLVELTRGASWRRVVTYGVPGGYLTEFAKRKEPEWEPEELDTVFFPAGPQPPGT